MSNEATILEKMRTDLWIKSILKMKSVSVGVWCGIQLLGGQDVQSKTGEGSFL